MLTGLDLPVMVLLMLAGVALDWMLGEVRRWHPLVGFGNLAGKVERWLNRDPARYLRGVLAWSLVVLPPVLLAMKLVSMAQHIHPLVAGALHAVLLYFCLGLRSLRDHVLPIQAALMNGELPLARSLTARIVTRDTGEADASDLSKAAIESTLENGNDAVFGTLFWFAVAGGPGAVLFRLANTLDAMWGYRSSRFFAFGWMAARCDDVLNWVPARLTALSYMLLGDRRRARLCWDTQAEAWPSPNAGPVMATGAGALGLALGGTAQYDGKIENRPPLGSGRPAEPEDIGRAWRLVGKTCLLWLGLLALAAWMTRS